MQLTCEWCDRPFEASSVAGKNYRLESAGVKICFICADLYEEEEIKLHLGKLKGRLDTSSHTVHTSSGHVLPVKLNDWHATLMGNMKANAVDLFGGRWVAVRNFGNTVTLKPV